MIARTPYGDARDQVVEAIQARQEQEATHRDRLWQDYWNAREGYLGPDDKQATPSGLLIRLREILMRAQTMQSAGAAKTLIRAALDIIDAERGRDLP